MIQYAGRQTYNRWKDPKSATVETPLALARYLFALLVDFQPKVLLDPCVGKGNLVRPWAQAGYKPVCFDKVQQGYPCHVLDFLTDTVDHLVSKPDLILMNPPFNRDANNPNIKGFMPLVFVERCAELFGSEVPMAVITQQNFRLNCSSNSSRRKKMLQPNFPKITSIVSLPFDCFDGVLLNTEILLFNLHGLEPHYFYSAPISTTFQKVKK